MTDEDAIVARTARDGGPTAPLTFGQLSLWRDVAYDERPLSTDANTVVVVDLPAAVERTALERAMVRLDAKHESLRTLFFVDEHGVPTQRLLPPLEVAEVEVVSVGDVETQVSLLTRRPYDLTRERPWRMQALSVPGEPDRVGRLLLAKHHIAADGWGTDLLLTDLRAVLGFGDEVPPAPQSLTSIAEEQRHDASWATRARATERHFRDFYKTPPSRFRNLDDSFPALEATLESPRLFEAARQVADSHSVSIATVLSAAYAMSLAEHCDGAVMRIGLMSSNRFADRWSYLVTSLNQLAVFSIRVWPHSAWSDLLAAVHWDALRAYRFSMYDVDRMSPQALGLSAEPGAEEPQARLNFLQVDGVQYRDDESDGRPVVHVEPAFKLFEVPCYLRVIETCEETIRLQANIRGLPEQDVRDLLQSMYDLVVGNADAPTLGR